MKLFNWIILRKPKKGEIGCALCGYKKKFSGYCILLSHVCGVAVCVDCEETAKAIDKITCGYFIMRSHIENGYPSPLPEHCQAGGDWLREACKMNSCWEETIDFPHRRNEQGE